MGTASVIVCDTDQDTTITSENSAHNLNYALIGNCQTCTLVSKTGEWVWLCLPSFDSPSVFARILDKQAGGSFSVVPTQAFTTTQQYIRNTNMLETRFVGDDFEFVAIDFMPRWRVNHDADYYYPNDVYRIIQVVRGTPEVLITFDPKLHYATGKTEVDLIDDWTLMARRSDDTNIMDKLFLISNLKLKPVLQQLPVTLTEDTFFLVSFNRLVTDQTVETVKNAMAITKEYWRRWVKTCYLPKHYQKELIRSALTLKMLVYQPSGAIIAAPTTSIPEIVGGNRNWDYRFCWLRDAYFIIEALLKLSRFEVMEGFTSYLKEIALTRLKYLRPMYTIDGRVVPEEVVLNHLAGYHDSRPVHVGNSATTHFQNDVYGEMILALYPLFTDERMVRDDLPELWELVQYLVAIAIEKFSEEDNGLWEFRNYPRHYTFSKLMCWAALDRGAKIAVKMKANDEAGHWRRVAKQMKAEILEHAWNPKVGAFTQAYGSSHLDASTLLMTTLGFIDPKDPRMESTVLRSEEKLMVNGLAFRYTNEDDFGVPENAFTICTFWMIDALIHIGQKRKARKYFEHVLTYANHVGLFSEDINPKTGELTGNFPQGYTHVAVINTAMLLAE